MYSTALISWSADALRQKSLHWSTTDPPHSRSSSQRKGFSGWVSSVVDLFKGGVVWKPPEQIICRQTKLGCIDQIRDQFCDDGGLERRAARGPSTLQDILTLQTIKLQHFVKDLYSQIFYLQAPDSWTTTLCELLHVFNFNPFRVVYFFMRIGFSSSNWKIHKTEVKWCSSRNKLWNSALKLWTPSRQFRNHNMKNSRESPPYKPDPTEKSLLVSLHQLVFFFFFVF